MYFSLNLSVLVSIYTGVKECNLSFGDFIVELDIFGSGT